jgi:hypothetical protein
MRRYSLILLIWLLAGVMELRAAPNAFADGYLVVKFKRAEVDKLVSQADLDPLGIVMRRLAMPRGSRLVPSKVAGLLKERRKGRRPVGRANDADIDFEHFFYLHLPANADTAALQRRLAANPLVAYAVRDPIGSALGVIPDDPVWTNQWAVRDSSGVPGRVWAPEAWALTRGTSSVIVAVLDTGVDTNLLEFAGRTVPGYNFMSDNNNADDDHGHGTAVASILCANGSNAFQIAGLDWNCRLMPLKMLGGAAATSSLSVWAEATYWAVTNNAKIINLSAGYNGPQDGNYVMLAEAVSNAVANGVLYVASAGNSGGSPIYFPASMPEVLSVGAIDTNGVRWSSSSWGTNLDIVAPGRLMYVLTNDADGVYVVQGTSYAAPLVSAAGSLICSLRPDLNSAQLASLLCAGALDQVGGDSTTNQPGYDLYYGWGQLNVFYSLQLAQTLISNMVSTGGSDVVLSWSTPSNASNRMPYVVEMTSDLTNDVWTADTNVTYGANSAEWTNTGAASVSQRFYRVQIKSY